MFKLLIRLVDIHINQTKLLLRQFQQLRLFLRESNMITHSYALPSEYVDQ